jgi:hypothetical protein
MLRWPVIGDGSLGMPDPIAAAGSDDDRERAFARAFVGSTRIRRSRRCRSRRLMK